MTTPTADRLVAIYRTASLMKTTDEKIRSLLMAGEIAISYYSPWGQEIVAAATAVHLQRADYIVTTYRGAHDQIAKGTPLKPLMAGYFGKVTGARRGKAVITAPLSGTVRRIGKEDQAYAVGTLVAEITES
jgi:TPP-dependent pyruvate/acetoin dehydrogenase alpha subunit